MKIKGKYISAPAVYALGTAAILILFYELWRLFLLFRSHELSATIPGGILIDSFLIGMRFDFLIAGVIMLLLYLVALVPGIDITRSKIMRRVNVTLLSILAGFTFLIHLVDLEFFSFFNIRLNGSAMLWNDRPGDVMSMIWDTYPVVRYLILWAAMLAVFVFLVVWFLRRIVSFTGRNSIWINLAYLPVVAAILALGIYGRVFMHAPFRWGIAYFSQYDFANQLAINPTYTFMRDIFNDIGERENMRRTVQKLDYPGAEDTARILMGRAPDEEVGAEARLVRQVRFDKQNPAPPNVILIIGESFASSKIDYLKNRFQYQLTPHFDSLAREGIFFTNFYSASMHTCGGIFHSLYGVPELVEKSVIKEVPGYTHLWGLPHILRSKGYRTIFFTAQDPQYDNMQGFLRNNDVMDMYGVFDYDQTKAMDWRGVPDHILFDSALSVCRTTARSGQKFFATILTGSNHFPWFVPDTPFEKVPDSDERHLELNAMRYADWAIDRFVKQVVGDTLLKNTIICITSDHGFKGNVTTDLDMSYTEIPFLILDTDHRLPRGTVSERLGSQLDILPTVMGLVHLDYSDYSFGKNLLDTGRSAPDFAFISSWHNIGFIENGYYLIMRLDGRPDSFFKLSDKSKDIADSLPVLVEQYKLRARALYVSAFKNIHRPLLNH